jgi:mRNA-degrading endonuclease RelE of RelBE toxin-antitoxin system
MSLFTKYSKEENQITSSLMAVLKNSQREILDKFFEEVIGNPFEAIQIINQSEKNNSRPDAEIFSSFQILIESKINSPFNKNQSENHIKSFDNNIQRKIFLIITREYINTSDLTDLIDKSKNIIIKNILWSDIYSFFNEISKEIIYDEKTRFLFQQITEYFEEIGIDKSWMDRCVIVPGEIAKNEAKYFGLCLWSPENLTRKSKYIAFYCDKKIELLYEIKSWIYYEFNGGVPEEFDDFKNNAEIVYGNNLKEIYDSLKELQNSNIHKWGLNDYVLIIFFDKDKNILQTPIEHKGKGAFIQRPSYKWFDDIKNAKTTDDIK